MLPNHKSSVFGFALLLSAVATAKPLESVFIPPSVAQAPTSFPLPSSVPSGTKIQVDGSSSMAAINQAMKQRFEQQFSGSTVNLNYSGTPAALQSLREGKIDLAAIGRPLSEAERKEGLVPVALERGKIAIITSPENPFKGSITVPQFVKIVRGEITDWSELGGAPGKIRFIDRPDLSDTRAAFRNYSVFIQSPYEVPTSAARTPEDSTQAVAQQLGKDGLSYAPANQVLNQPTLKIVPMHNTLPTDPRYPFSQPFFFVHKATPSPSAAALLGYATSDSGRQAAQTAENNPAALNLDSAALLAAGTAATVASFNTGAGAGSSPAATQSPTATASPGSAVPAAPSDGQGIVGQAPAGTTTATGNTNNEGGIPGWLWWLLPLGLGALLLGWLLRSRRSTPPVAEVPPTPPSPQAPPPPPPLMTPTEPDLASRTGSVISNDRASLSDPAPTIPPAAIGGAAIAGAGAAYALGRSESEAPEPIVEPELPEVETSIVNAEPPVIEPPTVPERPLVEIREMPPVEMEAPSIEPPEAPPEPDLGLPGAALGMAGLGAAGAAAWMSRTRTGVPPEAEPLASFDTIEELDEPEDAMLDQPALELDLDDAPTVVEEVPNYVTEPAIVSGDPNFTQGVIPGMAAAGSASALTDPVPVSDAEPYVEAIEPEVVLEEPPAIVEASEPMPEVESVIVEQALANSGTLPPAETVEATQESIPGLNVLGGAAAVGAGLAGLAAVNSQNEAIEPEIPHPTSEVTEPTPEPVEPIAEVSQPTPEPVEPTLEPAEPIAEVSQPISEPLEPSAIEPSPSQTLEASTDSVLPGIAAVGGAALAAGIAGMATRSNEDQTNVEATRFDVGQSDLSSETLATVDEGLPDLPDGYGESRIVLMPRDPQWAYAYWDVPNEHKSDLRNQGGQSLVLRLYDVTDVDLAHQSPHSLQQFDCNELARDWYLPIPVSDRDYVAEIGYLTADGRWLMLARSLPIRIPPSYPSAWENDQFITINWDEELKDKTFLRLVTPSAESEIAGSNGVYDQIFNLSQGAEQQRIAGSIFGSMQQVPTSAVSSFVFPSGMGMWALPTVSGMSGIGMSGVGMFSAGAVPIRPRKFWLVADAELIIYGATEPDATVSIAGETIPLNPDGTFRFQMSFQDGLIDYPILAIAKDGEQTRSIHLKFNRETPSRNTNTKDEAVDEWQS